MRIVIIADSFPPLKNSAAVLLSSLAETIAQLGHEVLVITASDNSVQVTSPKEDYGLYEVLRIQHKKFNTNNMILRGIGELILFFRLPYVFKKTSYKGYSPDLIIWYSPSIFLSGLVRSLKERGGSSYLILRDIVPEWLVDIGLIKKGFCYFLLKKFELYQYHQADFIGVQSPGNKSYIERLKLPHLKKLEVLPNWMPSSRNISSDSHSESSSISLDQTILVNRNILVYAGNLGEAQGIKNFSQLILELKNDVNIGFLIIGRGTKKRWLEDFIQANHLQNTLLLDEVDSVTLRSYYQVCKAGLVFLDPAHQTHNIP